MIDKMKNVLITTQHRGVFFAKIDETQLLEYKKRHQEDPKAPKNLIDLSSCRMAIYWNTKNGILELAHVGPNSGSKIGSPAFVDILHDVTSVVSVSDAAAEKWLSA